MIDGAYAVVTGLLGLDCVHSCHVELHPVWAIAMLVKTDPADEVWAIFVRNWGDEGFCSDKQHLLDRRMVSIRIPGLIEQVTPEQRAVLEARVPLVTVKKDPVGKLTGIQLVKLDRFLAKSVAAGRQFRSVPSPAKAKRRDHSPDRARDHGP